LSCNDTETDPRVNIDACRKVNARSMVVAPLFHVGDPVGVLTIMGHTPNAFSERDVQTLQLMAGLIGAAIGHQADYEANRRLLGGRTEALDALNSEIEQRGRVEASIRDNVWRTRMIIESSYDAFVAIDQSGVITDWNQQAEATFGWSRQEAIGAVLGELVIPEPFRLAHNAGMEHFLATGEGAVLNKPIELVGLRRGGEEFPVELTIRALQYLDGYEFCAFLRDITERKKTEQQLDLLQLSQSDPLTGVPNRTIFNDRIVEAMKRNQRTHSRMALLYLDIDRFKLVNDNYGHKIGDGLLKEYARRLRASVRATDTIARLGGDEFTIILEELKSPTDAEVVASKIIETLCKTMQVEDIHLTVTTSIGIAYYRDELDADELIHNADQAMYRAKKAGRNRMGK
jgi:diguanylate cyclase (GGDEF)-like protein/PAS domain S-box-containing protein